MLPLDISNIDSHSCLGVTSDACSNETEIDSVPNYCECDVDGIWTIIQKRFDGSIDFYRNWTEYKEGFCDVNCEYWLGNGIHQMTSNASYMLKIVMKDWAKATKYAMYDTFTLAEEADGYRLTIQGFSGDAGDSMKSMHNGLQY